MDPEKPKEHLVIGLDPAVDKDQTTIILKALTKAGYKYTIVYDEKGIIDNSKNKLILKEILKHVLRVLVRLSPVQMNCVKSALIIQGIKICSVLLKKKLQQWALIKGISLVGSQYII